MTAESPNPGFDPISIGQEEISRLMETYKALEVGGTLVLLDLEAINLVPATFIDTNFRLRTLVVRPGERDGIPTIQIHQRHAPIETLHNPDKRQVWASTVGTDQEELPIPDRSGYLEFRRTGSYVDLILSYDESSNSWKAEGKTLYPEEKPAELVNLATTLIIKNQEPNVSDLPLAA